MFLALTLASLVVLVVAAGYAVSRFVRLLRDAGSTLSALGESLDAVAAGAERAASRGDRMAASGERLERSLGRLGRSRARLQLLLDAYGDALGRFSSLVSLPRK